MIQHFLKICLVIIVLSVLSQVSIPINIGLESPIPITLQSLVVLVSAAFLNPWEAVAAFSLYVLIGILGLPVFADGNSGIEVITGGTGGYLVGFIIGGTAVAYLYSISMHNNLPRNIFNMFTGTVIIVICGLLYLTFLKGTEFAIHYGFYPIWQGGLIKIIIGGIIVYLIKRYFSEAR